MKKLAIIISILLLSFSSVYGAIIPGHYILDGSASNTYGNDSGTFTMLNGSTSGTSDYTATGGTIIAVGPIQYDLGNDIWWQDFHRQGLIFDGTLTTGGDTYTFNGTGGSYFTSSWSISTNEYVGQIGNVSGYCTSIIDDGGTIYTLNTNITMTEEYFTLNPNGRPATFGGTIVAGSQDISVVPVPAAVWLFGSGIIGLVGIRRRIKK